MGEHYGLSDAEISEMVAISHFQKALGHGTCIMAHHWHSHRRMVRMGLLTWKKAPSPWGRPFRQVALTEKGFDALLGIPDAEAILERQMALYDAEHEWDD